MLPAAAESVRAQDLNCDEDDWIEVDSWDNLQSGDCIRLIDDIKAGDGDSYLSISNKTVTLDLNEHTLNRRLMGRNPIGDAR